MKMRTLVKTAIDEELNKIEIATDTRVYDHIWSNILKTREKKNVFQMLKRIPKPLIAASSVLIVLIYFLFIPSPSVNVSAAKIIDNNMSIIMNSLTSLPKTSSSNPYDYIRDSNEFNNIVVIGPDALPIIKQRIDDSDENGLREYILAIAAEKIAKVDLKGDNLGWSTGKEWSDKWSNHLKNLSSNFKNIISSNKDAETKNLEIVRLGTPALPLIFDEVEQGNPQLIPSLQKLVEGNKKINFDINSIKDYKEWAKANKDSVQSLRVLVSTEQ